MRITAVETYHVAPRWLFVRIGTDTGVEGWGEPVVEGYSRSTETLVHEMGELLVGEDPRRVEHLWQALYRGSYYRGGPHIMSAISGIEQALWDITGKALGVPVHELFGGAVRDRIRMYAHSMDVTPEGAPAAARAAVARGFDAIKIGVSAPMSPMPTARVLDAEAARILAVREAVGPDVDVAIDFHGRLLPDAAIALIRRIEPAELLFIEEPVLPENPAALLRVQQATGARLATGERLFTRWGFREVIESQAAQILQPDLSHAGGISETRRIAAAAETYYQLIAPHNPLGPISLAAGLQIAACTPNFLIQEHPTVADRSDLGVGLLTTPFEIEDGHIARPTGPGLGIEVDLDAVRARALTTHWRTPQLRHPDGSVADW
ncbi:galactonate dehydratase [Cellulomonas dongxiuzhuiae]|uniref:galactonate dehydratase n=1 Tax=Cellulomonas dongxiuzhuiae TaxID=2819979 RepID=UPI001AAF4987|nr:galactonate dehydratase [Cellulomonas dongxiuzhuiae]MBO3088262.1 galactonate dehydratase [Cellulomonas dongxiuzhuiae]